MGDSPSPPLDDGDRQSPQNDGAPAPGKAKAWRKGGMTRAVVAAAAFTKIGPNGKRGTEGRGSSRVSIANTAIAAGAAKKLRKKGNAGRSHKDENERSEAPQQSSDTTAESSVDAESGHNALRNLIRKKQERKKKEQSKQEKTDDESSSTTVTSHLSSEAHCKGGFTLLNKDTAFEVCSLFGPEVTKEGLNRSNSTSSLWSEASKKNLHSQMVRTKERVKKDRSNDLVLLNTGTPFEVCSLFGPEVPGEARPRRSYSSSSLQSRPIRRSPRSAILRKKVSSSSMSGFTTSSSDQDKTSSGTEGGIRGELKRADKTKVQIQEKEPTTPKSTRKAPPYPTTQEKFAEEAKRTIVANYLASPRRAAICPLPTMSDVIVAAAAAKAIKLKSRDEVPAPSFQEEAERLSRRLLVLCQKGEWESGMEVLKSLDLLVTQKALGRTVLVETSDKITGNTPLMYAAIENRIGFMERLVALGCSVNTRNNEQYTALHFASMYAREDTVNWLLVRKGNPDLKGGPMEQTCVHLACARQYSQSSQIVHVLLKHSTKEARVEEDLANSSPLFTAIEAGNSNVCRELLSVEPERQLNRTKQPLNDTPMHLVARRKDANLAKIFIEAGAHVDVQNKEGQTVLHLASIMGDESMVRVLFMARANPNIVDNQDRAAVHLAAERGFSKIVEFLVEKFKASIYQRTRDGSTLMHIAAINGHPETAMILFERGVPLLMPNRFGARGIHTAAREGHVGVVNSLIKKGERVDARTGDGRTALHIAVEVRK